MKLLNTKYMVDNFLIISKKKMKSVDLAEKKHMWLVNFSSNSHIILEKNISLRVLHDFNL